MFVCVPYASDPCVCVIEEGKWFFSFFFSHRFQIQFKFKTTTTTFWKNMKICVSGWFVVVRFLMLRFQVDFFLALSLSLSLLIFYMNFSSFRFDFFSGFFGADCHWQANQVWMKCRQPEKMYHHASQPAVNFWFFFLASIFFLKRMSRSILSRWSMMIWIVCVCVCVCVSDFFWFNILMILSFRFLCGLLHWKSNDVKSFFLFSIV